MKALSLLQPRATLVALAGPPDPRVRALAKDLETRGRKTHYRGPLAIHAAKKLTDAAYNALVIKPFATVLEVAGICRVEEYYPGHFLCVADLVDCVQITGEDVPPKPERNFGDYRPGRWMWKLENVRMLPKPIPARGRQGLWAPEPDALAVLEASYKGSWRAARGRPYNRGRLLVPTAPYVRSSNPASSTGTCPMQAGAVS